jgi:hypothetical protein
LEDDKIMSPLATEGVYLADREQPLQRQQSEVDEGHSDDDDDDYEVEQRREGSEFSGGAVGYSGGAS